jgi:5-hydroxyisourate hydrolase
MGLSTHVLDTTRGRPAAGVRVTVQTRDDGVWSKAAEEATDDDGRIPALLGDGELAAGTWRLVFDTGGYFAASGTTAFYPQVTVEFTVADPGDHHHVPLLLSPFGYSTYRGS